MKRTDIYCQKCLSRNPLSETHCQQCGTRLLLVVFPQSLQYDTNHVPSFYEDHLLERVSLLELRVSQLSEQVRMAYEFIVREARSFKKDYTLFRSFFQALEEVNPEMAAQITAKITDKSNDAAGKIEAEGNQDEFLQDLLAQHDKPNREIFKHLVIESIKLLETNEENQAFRTLERALLTSPKNVPLLIFAAEKYFQADKFTEARNHLEKAFEIAPDNSKILLLLGAIYADEGVADEARKLLSVLTNHERTEVCVNYIWGMTAAFEENWTEGIAAFKNAMGKRETAELHYLTGCAFFQLRDTSTALHHLQTAVSLDPQYSDAWFMQAVIYRQTKEIEPEKQTRQKASENTEPGAQCLEFLRKNKLNPETALPFRHFKKKNPRILTGGGWRLSRLFREMILKAI